VRRLWSERQQSKHRAIHDIDCPLSQIETSRIDSRTQLLLRSLAGTSSCEVKFVANGERLHIDSVKHHVLEDSRNEYRFEMPYDDLVAMAGAQRVLGRYCDLELSLAQVHIERLRELTIRIREELAGRKSHRAMRRSPPLPRSCRQALAQRVLPHSSGP
jgi:hypothetical protein